MKKFNLNDHSIIYGILIVALMIVGQAAWALNPCTNVQVAHAIHLMKMRPAGKRGAQRVNAYLTCSPSPQQITHMIGAVKNTQHMCHGLCPGIQVPPHKKKMAKTTNKNSRTAPHIRAPGSSNGNAANQAASSKNAGKIFIPFNSGERKPHVYSNGISSTYYKWGKPQAVTRSEAGEECDSNGTNCTPMTLAKTDYKVNVTYSGCSDFGCDSTQSLAIELKSLKNESADIRTAVKERVSCQVDAYGNKLHGSDRMACFGRRISALPRKERLTALQKVLKQYIGRDLISNDSSTRSKARHSLNALADAVNGSQLENYLSVLKDFARDANKIKTLGPQYVASLKQYQANLPNYMAMGPMGQYQAQAAFNRIQANFHDPIIAIVEKWKNGGSRTCANLANTDFACSSSVANEYNRLSPVILKLAQEEEQTSQNPAPANQGIPGVNNMNGISMNRGASGRTSARALLSQFNGGYNNMNNMNMNMNGRMPFNGQFGPNQFAPNQFAANRPVMPNAPMMPNQFAPPVNQFAQINRPFVPNNFAGPMNTTFGGSTFAPSSTFNSAPNSIRAQFRPQFANPEIPTPFAVNDPWQCTHGIGPGYCRSGIGS